MEVSKFEMVFSTDVPSVFSEYTMVYSFLPQLLFKIGFSFSSIKVGLNTSHSSGVDLPCTMFSPNPHTLLMMIVFSNPLSGSMVHAAPEDALSLRTIC